MIWSYIFPRSFWGLHNRLEPVSKECLYPDKEHETGLERIQSSRRFFLIQTFCTCSIHKWGIFLAKSFVECRRIYLFWTSLNWFCLVFVCYDHFSILHLNQIRLGVVSFSYTLYKTIEYIYFKTILVPHGKKIVWLALSSSRFATMECCYEPHSAYFFAHEWKK